MAQSPRLLGIVNVTPDSFFDGSKDYKKTALKRAKLLIRQGADMLDIGGESTRPGALPVETQEEIARTLPVIKALHQLWPRLPLSIDTQKAAVAELALKAGAQIVNDVSALRFDSGMASLICRMKARVILMHMQGRPGTMQKHPRYKNVVQEVFHFLKERIRFAQAQGIHRSRIWADPGIGFGKTLSHNLELLRQLDKFHKLGVPLVLGASRKSFIGKILNVEAQDRLEGSLAAALWGVQARVDILRVHDVEACARIIKVWQAIRG
jgi:dihydropteroate synthase